MFTHIIKSSNQRCFPACWWPHADKAQGIRERIYPLMMFESGQCNRVNFDNLQKLNK